jgi:electron transfer flavoprotein alpha subunit
MSVLVFVEIKDKLTKAVQEAITYGKSLGKVTLLTYGEVSESLLLETGLFGVENILICRSLKERSEQLLSKLIVKAVKDYNCEYIVLSQDQTGKAVGPRVAANLEAGHISGAISFPEKTDEFTVKTNVFSGKAIAFVTVHTPIKVISILPNSVAPMENKTTATITEFNQDLGDARIKVKEIKALGDGIPLPEAELVVSAGRGLKGPENWGIVEDLASSLGATTACSRPVADIGWRPHHEHVGQTGVAIRPNLYIAAGISGAIQHLAGVNGSKVIVVINTDPEAPFFKAADYGIIGDAFDVLPRLTSAINNFKSSQ